MYGRAVTGLRAALLALVLLAACGSGHGTPTAAPTLPVAAAPTLAPPLPGTYAALGASETYGVGAHPYTEGYAYQVAKILGAKRIVDLGIPGATLPDAWERELTSALSARPSLCTVFFGVNDLNDQVDRGMFLQDLHDLVATLRQEGSQVLIVGLPDLTLVPAVRSRHPHGIEATVTSWNAGMRQVADATGARFLDLADFNRELRNHPEYISSDGLHPSNAGHTRLAQIVARAILSQGLWKQETT